jgi:hypothetical protein
MEPSFFSILSIDGIGYNKLRVGKQEVEEQNWKKASGIFSVFIEAKSESFTNVLTGRTLYLQTLVIVEEVYGFPVLRSKEDPLLEVALLLPMIYLA